MPPKPPPGKGKPVPQITNTDRFNLEALKTDDAVQAQIEAEIAKTKASELSKFVAVVTGAASGLGREICKAFADEKTKVAILDKDQVLGQALASELTTKHGSLAGVFFHCNLVDPKSFENAIKAVKTQMGRFDIVVNSAACFSDNVEKLDGSISLNFKTVVSSSLLAVHDMGAKTGGNGGLVINIADSLAFLPAFLTPIYAATKAAVIKFTMDMAQPQLMNLSKVGFLAIVPNGFKGGKLFDDPKDKVLIPGRDMLDAFTQKFDLSHAQQTAEHVAKSIVEIVKTGAKSGVFLIENGEPFKKIDMPVMSVKNWLPEKL